MKPTEFKLQNCVYGKGQKDYIPLPAFHDPNDEQGKVTSCWKLSLWERLRAFIFGRVYVLQLTFGYSLQPLQVHAECPLIIVKKEKEEEKKDE